MDIVECSPTEAKWKEAMLLMESALDMLDDSRAPADIGSHLDMAICRLEDALGCNPADNAVEQLRTEIENALIRTPDDVTDSDTPIWSSRPGTPDSPSDDRSLMFR